MLRVRVSLLAVLAVSSATAARSLALEKWVTVLAAFVMIAGALAALRAKTWGVGVVLAAATAFSAAAALGIAPMWFWLVGAVGALPFLFAWRPMVRFDRGAAVLFAAIAVTLGIAGPSLLLLVR
jgi:hypothetical protein